MILEEKVAIVTGAARGIGEVIARKYAENGAKIVIADVNISKAQEVAEEISENYDTEAIAVETDVSNSEDVDKMVNKTVEKFGKVDILVNNAGIFSSGSIVDQDEEDWDKVIDINLKGQFLCTQRVVQEMLEQGKGRIINIASISGETGWNADDPAYCASKGGTIALTKELSCELTPKGITVNAVSPGHIKTEMTEPLLDEDDHYRASVEEIPKGRMGKPEDIAGASLYLASDEADFVSGQILTVDGGWINHSIPKFNK